MRFDGAIVRPVVWPVILALLWFGADLLGITEHIVRSVAAMSHENDTLIWPHRDGLIWPRPRHSGVVVTV